MFNSRRGQGSTEYLVLLAMVLVVAMVAIALLGFFPGLAGDARAGQSDAYWRGTARPFAILEHSLATGSGSSVNLAIQNLDSNSKYLKTLNLTGTGINASNSSVNTYISAGQTVSSIAVALTAGSCTTGTPYEFNVTFTYDSVGGITGNTQRGTKPLVGVCG